MPTAGQPRSSPLDHVTRQQLDELDALMQRMLALPVSPPEESPRVPTGQPQAVQPPAMQSDAATEPARPVEVEQKKTEVTASGAGFAPEGLSAEDAEVRKEAAPQHVPLRTSASSASSASSALSPKPLGALTQPRSPAPEATTEIVRPPHLPWPLRPFLWVNVVFDRVTAWLGPVGRWLRAPGGRTLLGWTGLLLLAAALAWLVLDGMGWTW